MGLGTSGEASTHDRRLLIFVVSSILLGNVGVWLFGHAVLHGNPGGIKGELTDFLHVRQWTDSWLPMIKSLDYFHAHPTEPIYAAKLYDTLIYSLPSLLPLVVLEKLGLHYDGLLRVLAVLSWLAVWAIGAVSLSMASRLLKRDGLRLGWMSVLAVMLACVSFYPIIKGYALGNAQTFLTLGFAALLYCWATGRERVAGVLAAGLAMVKPQYVLLLVWMALRRRWNGLVSGLIFAAVCFGIAIAVFGLKNNLDYLPVLASLSHKAQSHFANQSMFGTINRMIFNGENLPYHPFVYSPYIPWVYYTTVATSLLMVATVLLFPWRGMRGSAGDLAAMGIVSVAASPMAWEHHYGVVFPVFCWVWFSFAGRLQRRPWGLALCFLLTANFLSPFNALWNVPVANVLQSYLYFGALGLVGYLMWMSRQATPPRRA